jgi:phosphate transport system substrate-binding protein
MKRPINLIIIFIAFAFCLNFCKCKSGDKKEGLRDTPKSGTIHISIDESFRPVIEDAIKVYEGSYPQAHIIAHYKPEADCFKDFYGDSTNRMIIVTRGLTSKESRFYTDSLGYTPVSNKIAWDAITIVTNKSNTDTLFTLETLQQLLQGKKGNAKKVVFDGFNATSTVRFAIDSILHGGKFDSSVVRKC